MTKLLDVRLIILDLCDGEEKKILLLNNRIQKLFLALT